jgi:hypothetical protein
LSSKSFFFFLNFALKKSKEAIAFYGILEKRFFIMGVLTGIDKRQYSHYEIMIAKEVEKRKNLPKKSCFFLGLKLYKLSKC